MKRFEALINTLKANHLIKNNRLFLLWRTNHEQTEKVRQEAEKCAEKARLLAHSPGSKTFGSQS